MCSTYEWYSPFTQGPGMSMLAYVTVSKEKGQTTCQ